MEAKTNILITGSTGFIGSSVFRELLKNKNNYFFLLIREESNVKRINNFLDTERVKIFFFKDLEKIFKINNIDFVLHLGTNYIKFDEPNDHKSLTDDNISKPSKILDLSLKYKARGFINTGTFFEVDDNESFVTEQSNIKPYNFYAKTKVKFQQYLDSSCDEINSVTLRLFSPYGPDDNQKVIPFITKAFLKNIDFEIENPHINCDFTYVEDIALAYKKAIQKIDEGFELPSLINICSGQFYTLNEIIKILKSISRSKINPKFRNNTKIPVKRSSNKLANEILGWNSNTSINDGLLSTYNFYNQNN